MAKNSRKGKPIVRQRKTNHVDNSLLQVSYTITQAFDHFVSFKKTIGVRSRTMKDYFVLMGYFREWLNNEVK